MAEQYPQLTQEQMLARHRLWLEYQDAARQLWDAEIAMHPEVYGIRPSATQLRRMRRRESRRNAKPTEE